MNRTTTTLACLLGLGAMTHAQIITQANAVPPFGPLSSERFFVEDVPWNLLDTLGSDLLWDLSGLNFVSDGPVEFFVGDVANSPYASAVPNAAIFMEEIGDGYSSLDFYNNLPGSLELIATGVGDPDNTFIWEDCPTLQMTYPGVLGTTVSPSLAGCDLELLDYERRILANGSIATSFGNIDDVVLIRTRLCEMHENDGQWVTECHNLYEWYQIGNILVPVISTELNNDNAYLVVNVFEGTAGAPEQTATELTLSPNPATDHLVVHHRDGAPLGEVRILGADGRPVNVVGTTTGNRLQIDVRSLTPGVYLLQRLRQGRTETGRFVKQ
ncbi:MAG: T9SS type A sorting domain-containing protein [Flavobacteriales bacterium]